MKTLEIEETESRIYLYLLENGAKRTEELSAGLGVKVEDVSIAVKRLLEKGFIIDHPSDSYTPLHPRMALTNAYHIIQQRYDERLKEKRLMVDQIAFLLESAYEKRVLGSEPEKSSF